MSRKSDRIPEFINMAVCDVCKREYRNGPHRYEGHRLHLYGDISCCDICWEGNWDGWNPGREPVLLEHLERQDLPVPPRNKLGWLPRN